MTMTKYHHHSHSLNSNPRQNTKMTASKFKDDMLAISGITNERITSGVYFMGIKKKPEIAELDE